MTERIDRVVPILNGAAGLMLLVSLFMIFFYAPDELTMGNVQRIFYFHVGSAWVAAITFLISLIAGVSYLIRPSKTKDTIALASVEIGVVFATMTIVSGSIWGRPAWNTWWIWSPRLTSMTVMWLVYVAYFMLRGAIDDDDRRGRFAAVYVIAAFITVLMAYVSIRLLRDIHPVVFGGAAATAQGADEGLQEIAPGLDSAKMGITLMVSVLTFSLIYLAWLANRLRLQRIIDETAALKAEVMARLQS